MRDTLGSMNSYERLLTTIGHTKPDRPPLQIMATDEVMQTLRAAKGLKDEEELLKDLGVDFRLLAYEIDKKQVIPEQIMHGYRKEGQLTVSCYGVVLLHNENFPQAHRIHGPLYDTDDLNSFDWPKPSEVENEDTLKSIIEDNNRAGLCSLVRCDNPFKIAYFMRSFEDFMVDCILHQDYALELLKRIADIEFTRVENGVKAGARCARVFGDFADQRSLMISPEAFRKVLKPVLADFVQRLKCINRDVKVFLHSDGNLMEILSDLIECGFDAVHPLQLECMDMYEVKRKFGHRLTLFGGVSVQSELPFLPEGEIRRLVRERIDTLGENGGFIVAPGNSILPDVPVESVFAMYDEGSKTV